MSQKDQSAKYTFFYLLSLVSLFFMAFFSGGIWFQLINKYIPDTLNYYGGRFESGFLNFAIAAVLVATPIYFLLMNWIKKGLRSGELNSDSELRKWLTYLIIFATSATSIGWLIGIISTYLDGGMTSQFVFKAMTALIISIGTLTYYVYDIKKESFENKDKIGLTYFIVAIVLIITTLVFGFVAADGPAKNRMLRHDRQVLNEMDSLSYEIGFFYQENDGELPDNLTEVNRYSDNKVEISYKKLEGKKYELCSEFEMSSEESKDDNMRRYENKMNFEAGYSCIEFEINEDLVGPKFID